MIYADNILEKYIRTTTILFISKTAINHVCLVFIWLRVFLFITYSILRKIVLGVNYSSILNLDLNTWLDPKAF